MALIAGEVDFSIMSAFLLIPVSIQSGDVIMLGAFGRYATMTLISRSEIRTAEELKGKIIGLQRPGDATEINARFALRHLGLDPYKDVSFLYLGSNELMWPALQTKKVAATVLQPPWTLLARKSGMNFLVDLADLKIEYQGSTLASRRSFIRDNPNLTRRVVRAIVRGVHFFYSRKEESLRILAKFLATDNTEALEEGYRYAKFPASTLRDGKCSAGNPESSCGKRRAFCSAQARRVHRTGPALGARPQRLHRPPVRRAEVIITGAGEVSPAG